MKVLQIMMVIALLYSNALFSQQTSSSSTQKRDLKAAQTLPLCEAFDLLVISAASDFSDFNTFDVIPDGDNSQFNSTLQIKGAKSTCVSDNPYGISFDCLFGTYQTEEEAVKALTELQNGFVKCKPGFGFIKVQDVNTGMDDYVFVYKNSNGAKYYNAFFGINKLDTQIDVVFSMFTYEVCKEYTYLTNEPDQSPSADEIRKITEYAKTKFKTIQGAKVGSVRYYPSTFCLTGLTDCRISPFYKRNLNGASDNRAAFLVNVVSSKSKEEFDKGFDGFYKQVAAALGKGYAVTTLKSGSVVSFCLKENIGNVDKELILIEKNQILGEYRCILSVYAEE